MARAVPACLAAAAVAAAFALAFNAKASVAPTKTAPVTAWLAQADDSWPDDTSRFRQILVQLHQHEGQLSTSQRWHLRLLDTRLPIDEGNYAKAEPSLYDIINHSGDQSLSVRAMAALIQVKYFSRYYVSND